MVVNAPLGGLNKIELPRRINLQQLPYCFISNNGSFDRTLMREGVCMILLGYDEFINQKHQMVKI